MNEMINYIFESLRLSNNSFSDISKFIQIQNRTNKSITIFMMAAVAYLIVSEMRRIEMEAKFIKLKKEIEEFKRGGRRLKCDDRLFYDFNT